MASKKYNMPFIIVLMVTSGTGNAQWAYLQAVTNSVLTFLTTYIFTGLTTPQQSLIASTLVIGAFFGTIAGGPLTRRYGRRKILFISDFITLVGIGLTMISSYGAVLAGRVIEGISLGLLCCISPLYTAEMIPTPIRGIAGVINEVILYSGMVIALAIGYTVPRKMAPGETNNAWRLCYAFVAVFPIIRIIFFTFFQKFETPVHYVNKNDLEGARQILGKIYREDSESVLERIIKDRQYFTASGAKRMAYRDLLTKKYIKAVLMGVFLIFIHQFTGIGFMFIYSKRLFQYGMSATDSTPTTLTLLIGVISVITTIFASFVVDRFGRRKQYIPSLVGLSVVCLAYAIITTVHGPESVAAKVMLLIYPIFFGLAGGSITFLYLGETLSEIGLSAVVPTLWVFSFIISQVSLSLLESIGPNGIFFIFAGFSALGAIISAAFLIESKGKSKAEMIALYSGIPEEKVIPKCNAKEGIELQVKTRDPTDAKDECEEMASIAQGFPAGKQKDVETGSRVKEGLQGQQEIVA